MSTREEHPLDERFRALLHDAEATPPPLVWQGVRQGLPATGRRRGRWLLGLLLLLFTSAGIWALGPWAEPAATPGARAVRPAKDNGVTKAEELGRIGHAPMQEGIPPHTTADHSEIRSAPFNGEVTGAHDQGNIVVSEPHLVIAEEAPDVSLRGPRATIRPSPPGRPKALPGELRNPSLGAAIPVEGLPDEDATWTAVRAVRLLRVEQPGTPLTRLWDPVVLPRSEWWAGVHLGSYMYRHRWLGEDQRLTDALDGAYGMGGSIVPGLAVERHWRSGWGLATGAWAGISEQRFHAVSRRTWVEQDIQTYLVTLNDQVFVSNVDTVEHVMHEETGLQGSTRRTVLFVPVEALWRQQVRRFHYGVRAGVVAGLPMGGSGTMLGHTGDDGPLTTIAATRQQLVARRPASLSLSAGIEVGYALHERWALAVGARYMHGTLPFGAARDAYGLTDRWGLECRLLHHIKWNQ